MERIENKKQTKLKKPKQKNDKLSYIDLLGSVKKPNELTFRKNNKNSVFVGYDGGCIGDLEMKKQIEMIIEINSPNT